MSVDLEVNALKPKDLLSSGSRRNRGKSFGQGLFKHNPSSFLLLSSITFLQKLSPLPLNRNFALLQMLSNAQIPPPQNSLDGPLKECNSPMSSITLHKKQKW